VVDRFAVTGREPNAQVAVELDAPAFWGHVEAAVRTLGAVPA
jgi:inosine-uridine nucleoside N-ribohydrolase